MTPGREVEKLGDFTVLEDDLRQAEQTFSERSKGSQSRDESFRAPIATDYETWEENQRVLDFPGVDTPTDRPRHAAHDMPLPGDTAADDGVGVDVERGTDTLSEIGTEYGTAMDSLAESVSDLFE